MAEQNHIILIKNMVCNRCVLVVTEMLKGLHLTPLNVELGKAVVQEELKPDDWKNIKEALEKYGFEWIDDKRMRIIVFRSQRSQHREVLYCPESGTNQRVAYLR